MQPPELIIRLKKCISQRFKREIPNTSVAPPEFPGNSLPGMSSHTIEEEIRIAAEGGRNENMQNGILDISELNR